MRRFPDDALLETRAREGLLEEAEIERLARRLARFHDGAEIARGSGGAGAMRQVLSLAAESLRRAPPASGEAIDAHLDRLSALLDRHAALLDARDARGSTRHGHGDLTLRNICLFEGEPTPFDCIEFSDALARIDTLYDLAFLLMDLWRLGLKTARQCRAQSLSRRARRGGRAAAAALLHGAARHDPRPCRRLAGENGRGARGLRLGSRARARGSAARRRGRRFQRFGEVERRGGARAARRRAARRANPEQRPAAQGVFRRGADRAPAPAGL